jgi:hypothetical protein
MSSRKKLVLGPLPEQREDYSNYEESVVRWDRIIIAGVLLVLIVSAIVGLLMSQSSTKPDASMTVSEEPADSTKSLVEDSQAIQSKAHEVLPAPIASEKESKLKVEKAIKPAASLSEGPSVALPGEEVTDPTQSSELASNPTLPQSNPASVLITNSAIKEASLHLSTDQGVQGDKITHSIQMPQKGLIKVMLTTEMHGLQGNKLYHEWYRNGKRQARVTIPVNVKNQRSHSSKFIDKYMLGSWQVKVVDQANESYVLADFEVVGSR